jgi:hypothetical protein
METLMNNLPGIRSRFLQQAGLISALLGTFSFLALILALVAKDPFPKFQVGIIAVMGILLSYTLGRDVLIRVKYAEAGAELISSFQQRLARVGTRFPFILFGLFVVLLLMTIAFLLVSPFDRTIIVCSRPTLAEMVRCLRDIYGIYL